MSQDDNAINHPTSSDKGVTRYDEFLGQKVGLARSSFDEGKFLTSEQVEGRMRAKKEQAKQRMNKEDLPSMTTPVTLKTAKFENHSLYVLEAYEVGNSTEFIIAFEDGKSLRGIVVVGEWEFNSFFRLASKVSDRLKESAEGRKSITVSLPSDDAAPMRLKAEQQWNTDKWKVVFSCLDPSQCWKAWESTSGSQRNFILYLTFNEMVSMFDELVKIQEDQAQQVGFIKQSDSWVELSNVDDLNPVAKRIVLSARDWLKQFGRKLKTY